MLPVTIEVPEDHIRYYKRECTGVSYGYPEFGQIICTPTGVKYYYGTYHIFQHSLTEFEYVVFGHWWDEENEEWMYAGDIKSLGLATFEQFKAYHKDREDWYENRRKS